MDFQLQILILWILGICWISICCSLLALMLFRIADEIHTAINVFESKMKIQLKSIELDLEPISWDMVNLNAKLARQSKEVSPGVFVVVRTNSIFERQS